MSMARSGSILVVGFLMALGLASTSQAEDTLGFAVDCGSACGVGTLALPETLVATIPGGVYVVTVAYLAPSFEDAFVNGDPVECNPVEFRIDTLQIGRDGAIEVEIGEKQELAQGKATRVVHEVSPNAVGAASEMNQMAFSLRAAKVKGPCRLIAGGMQFDEDPSTKPSPFSLLVNDGTARSRRAR